MRRGDGGLIATRVMDPPAAVCSDASSVMSAATTTMTGRTFRGRRRRRRHLRHIESDSFRKFLLSLPNKTRI